MNIRTSSLYQQINPVSFRKPAFGMAVSTKLANDVRYDEFRDHIDELRVPDMAAILNRIVGRNGWSSSYASRAMGEFLCQWDALTEQTAPYAYDTSYYRTSDIPRMLSHEASQLGPWLRERFHLKDDEYRRTLQDVASELLLMGDRCPYAFARPILQEAGVLRDHTNLTPATLAEVVEPEMIDRVAERYLSDSVPDLYNILPRNTRKGGGLNGETAKAAMVEFARNWKYLTDAYPASYLYESSVIQRRLELQADYLFRYLKEKLKPTQFQQTEYQGVLRAIADEILWGNSIYPDAFARPILKAAGKLDIRG